MSYYTLAFLLPSRFVFEKKVRDGSEMIYGSLSEINVAEEVVKATAVPIRRTSVSIPKACFARFS